MNRHFLGVGLALLIVTNAFAAGPAVDLPTSALQSQAISLYRAKRYTEAAPLYRQLAKQMPDNPDILQDLLWTLWYASHYDEVITVAAHLGRLQPDNAAVWALAGRALFMKGRHDEALQAFQKSLALDPGQPQLRLDVARTQIALRNYPAAIQTLQSLLRQEPDFNAGLPDLAHTQFLLGQFANSAKTWTRAAAAFPDKPDYPFNAAQAWYFSGKQARALAQMKTHLKTVPHHRLTVNFLVDTALARGDRAEAAAVLEQDLSEPDPAEEARYVRLAAIYQDLGDAESSRRTLERVLQANPWNGRALLMRADHLKDEGNFGDAERYYERILQRNPWSFQALRAMADLNLSLGRPSDALRFIRKARRLDPTDPYMLFMEANYLFAQGEKADSNALLKQWLKANPGPTLPILLYHGISPFRRDPMLAYPIHTSVAAFDDQIRALKQAGFNPITAPQAQDWLQGKGALPDKPILITFDDARLDSFRYGDPVLKKYEFKATMTVALANVDRNLPGFTSWSQLKMFQRSGRWDMQAHGNLGHIKIPMDEEGHLGLFMANKQWLEKEKRLETPSEWEERNIADMEQTTSAMETHLGVTPVAFAFPEGEYGQDSLTNFPEGPPRLLQRARELYGSLYHQDGYGINVRSRDPSFLTRFEVSEQWKGADLIRHLIDQDPVVVAKRALFRQALWDGKTHEAKVWLAELQAAGVSSPVLLTDEARLQASLGDRPRAWELAVRARDLDPQNREIQSLLKSLEQEKRWAWTPRVEYFEDNNDRENWFFEQQLETLQTGHLRWQLTQFHGSFREQGLPNIQDDGGGVGVSVPLGDDHELSARGQGHVLSGVGDTTYSANAGVQSRWTDHFRTNLKGGRAPFPTARR